MENVLLVIQVLIAVAMVGVILLQKTAQDGGGLMGSGNTMGGMLTARGSANLLTRVTAALATLFILNSLALGYIASNQHQTHSILDQIAPVAPVTAPATAPAADKAPETKAPEAPQVPMAQ